MRLFLSYCLSISPAIYLGLDFGLVSREVNSAATVLLSLYFYHALWFAFDDWRLFWRIGRTLLDCRDGGLWLRLLFILLLLLLSSFLLLDSLARVIHFTLLEFFLLCFLCLCLSLLVLFLCSLPFSRKWGWLLYGPTYFLISRIWICPFRLYGPIFYCISHSTRLRPFSISFLIHTLSLFLFLLNSVILLNVPSSFRIIPHLSSSLLLGLRLSLRNELSSLQFLSQSILFKGRNMLSFRPFLYPLKGRKWHSWFKYPCTFLV